MRRRPFILCAFVPLLLFAATLALWVRSYYAVDRIGRVNYSPGYPHEDHHLYLQASNGILQLIGGGDPAENFSHVRWDYHCMTDYAGALGSDAPRVVRAIGVGWSEPRQLITAEWDWGVQVHLALPATLLTAATVFIALRTRHHVVHDGRCPTCGYDLRATPDRCPECGAAAPQSTSARADPPVTLITKRASL